jgi:hypothetical protein
MLKVLRELDSLRPDWRLEYGDPLTAAIELGIIEPEEIEIPPIDLTVDEDNWERFYRYAESYHWEED